MSLQELLKELKGLEFETLIDLYLEAKTGKHTTALDLLPIETQELISELEAALNDVLNTSEQ